MTIKRTTLMDIIEDATGYEVYDLKETAEFEELGRTVIYVTADMTIREDVKGFEIVTNQICHFIYCVDFHELMDENWNVIG